MRAFTLFSMILLLCLAFVGLAAAAQAQTISNVSVNTSTISLNGGLNVTYTLAGATGNQVYLQAYDPNGLIVRTIDAGLQGNGVHTITWNGCYDNGSHVPAGNYSLMIVADGAGSVPDQMVNQWSTSDFNQNDLYGVAVAPDGILYAGDDTVIGMMYPNGTLSQLAGGFNSLSDIALDSHGDLIAADGGANTVNLVYPNGTVEQLADTFSFNYPWGVAIDPQDNIYVSETVGQQVDVIYPNDSAKALANSAAFSGSEGMAVGPNGDLYVCVPPIIQAVRTDGSIQQFSSISANDVAFDSQGNMYIADSTNNSLEMIYTNGTFVTLANNPDPDSADNQLWGVAIGPMDNVFVSDGSYIYEYARPNVTSNLLDVTYNNSVQPVQASFTANVTSGTAPLTVQFNDTSSGATSWSWNFGDGSNSTLENPVHTFTNVSSYNVSLTATNSAGSNTTTRSGLINVDLLVSGAVGTPLSLSMADLNALPLISENVSYSQHGANLSMNVTGASLNALLNETGPVSSATSVTFTGSDGFGSAISLAAIRADPNAIIAFNCTPDGTLRKEIGRAHV